MVCFVWVFSRVGSHICRFEVLNSDIIMSDQAKIRHDACLVCFAKEEGLILHDKVRL